MPRKKADQVAVDPSAVPAAAVAAILCPACKSKIGSDGKTLHEKSGYLEELVETDTTVDEIEKNIGGLEKEVFERDATIADLRGRLASAETQLAAAKKPQQQKENAGELVPKNQTAGGGDAKSKSWWD
jgi:chromosome segregation ATPase